MRFRPDKLRSAPLTALSDRVLVLVMRKLDRELPFSFRLGWLTGIVGIAESEARILTRRGAHMTNGADGRPGSDHGLPREELLPVAANAGIVIGKVSRIRKRTTSRPRCGNPVTSIALETLVLVR